MLSLWRIKNRKAHTLIDNELNMYTRPQVSIYKLFRYELEGLTPPDFIGTIYKIAPTDITDYYYYSSKNTIGSSATASKEVAFKITNLPKNVTFESAIVFIKENYPELLL